MAILKIAQIGEPVLREHARPVSREELSSVAIQTLIDDMIETMRDANGAGIAANQVYQAVQICVIETRGNNPRYPYKPTIPLTVMVNPVITPLSDETFDNLEGCLSVPNLRGMVPRHARIHLEYLDRYGNSQSADFVGVSAGTFQHECDHLAGQLYVDKVTDPASLSTLENFVRHHEAKRVAEATAVVERFGG
ncbi:MAG: peptide deformylase [Gammaproteobacteria bacterium]